MAVANDPSKRITNDCGRRTGKTTGTGKRLAKSAENNPAKGGDESIIAYVAPTKNQAKRLMWGKLQWMASQEDLPYEFQATELIARHKNGAQIWLMGANDDRDVERLRGFAYRRVEVDEAQAIGANFEDLVDEVLDPALADYDGTLVLSGTPNASCCGYFHDASTGAIPGWSNHHGTILDNPYFPRWRGRDNWREEARAWLEGHRTKRGWNEDHPTYQREWLGKWVRDEGGLVYKYEPSKNDYDGTLPDGYTWEYVAGVDFGHDDCFAVVVWAFCRDLPDLYEVYTYKKAGLTVSDWGRIIRDVEQRFDPIAEPADTGALGKAITKELNQRFGCNLQPAEKKEKNANIDLMNSDFKLGILHIRAESPMKHTLQTLQWSEKFTGDRRREDPRFVNDDTDAGLYGYREAKHWAWQPREVRPEFGTTEYTDSIADDMMKKEEDAFNQKQGEEWWEQ